jgi:hypothetical protein
VILDVRNVGSQRPTKPDVETQEVDARINIRENRFMENIEQNATEYSNNRFLSSAAAPLGKQNESRNKACPTTIKHQSSTTTPEETV